MNRPDHKHRRQDERLFQLLFWLSFPLFVALAFGARVLPGAKHGLDAAGSGLFADAAAAARSTIAIALMD